MFLVTDTNSTIKAYDVTTFRPTRHWLLSGMDDPWDIRSCPKNRCLYVFNWKPTAFKEIWRVCPESMKVVKKWSTGNDAGRLSVTHDANVLLAVHSNNKINEYTANGQLVRDIKLNVITGVRHPWHAVKLTNGHYVFSYGDLDDAMHGVCVVDGKGQVVRLLCERKGLSLRNLDVPVNLLIDKRGQIMVADHNNGRVLLLNANLEPQKAIISRSQGLRKPIRLAMDEASGCLYVADCEFDFATRKWKEGEVLIMRIK